MSACTARDARGDLGDKAGHWAARVRMHSRCIDVFLLPEWLAVMGDGVIGVCDGEEDKAAVEESEVKVPIVNRADSRECGPSFSAYGPHENHPRMVGRVRLRDTNPTSSLSPSTTPLHHRTPAHHLPLIPLLVLLLRYGRLQRSPASGPAPPLHPLNLRQM